MELRDVKARVGRCIPRRSNHSSSIHKTSDRPWRLHCSRAYAQALAPNADAQPFVTSSGSPPEYPPEDTQEDTLTDANNRSRSGSRGGGSGGSGSGGGGSSGGGISQDIDQDSSSGDINQSFEIS